jgi:hypothetical protein
MFLLGIGFKVILSIGLMTYMQGDENHHPMPGSDGLDGRTPKNPCRVPQRPGINPSLTHTRNFNDFCFILLQKI